MKFTLVRGRGLWISMILAGALLALPLQAAVDSGSICATNPTDPDCLGDVVYSVDTQIALPPDGILQYGSLTISAGVALTFGKNTVNTPVVILASGDVTIAGIIGVSASAGKGVGTYGDGNIGDDGDPGLGGPGGYDGGFGGLGGGYGGSAGSRAGTGLGPGGGQGGPGNAYQSGGGGGFSAAGGTYCYYSSCGGQGGPAYGQISQMPLVGGSGGGGGPGGANFTGTGGGGGGGAILIVSSSTIDLTGNIYANGNSGGTGQVGGDYGGCGGGGSGGAVRLVATTINGNGLVQAQAGGSACSYAGSGAHGRIRMEFENYGFTGSTNPAKTVGDPGSIFVPDDPTLRIASVGGVTIPAEPTGAGDAVFPEDVTQPVTVTLEASQIPLGTTVTVWVKPQTGAEASYLSTALAGTLLASTASADVTLPPGPSVLEAITEFTLVVAGKGMAALTYGDETIESAELRTSPTGQAELFYVTESGKRIPEEEVGPLAYALMRTGNGS